MDARAVATLFDALPETPDARTLRAYRILAAYTAERYAQAHVAGWRFLPETTGAAPDMARAHATKVLPVYDRDHGHPCFADGENFMFRAVHDVFGHDASKTPAPFTFTGEIQAWHVQDLDLSRWLHQCRYHSSRWESARLALFCEIVGQAAYFEAHGRFPTLPNGRQKAGLIDWRKVEL